MKFYDYLNQEQKDIISSIKKHSESLLDRSPKFRYFTLHGRTHINSMFEIAELLKQVGFSLGNEEIYLFSIAICIHDLGMVVPLNQDEYKNVFGGLPQIIDPANLELYIRDIHHERVKNYVSNNFAFLSSLGINPPQLSILKDIAILHRKASLEQFEGFSRKLGALIRIVDELDIGPLRAPIEVFLNNYQEMDATSCWHWFKHNIVRPWNLSDNIKQITYSWGKKVLFQLSVSPPHEKSIHYWLHQIRRPILKVLNDEGVNEVLFENWKIKIEIENSFDRSKPNPLDSKWEEIENKALSHERKVILVIDDEVRKMHDLFIPLMGDYYVEFSPNARDALRKLKATSINLAIVDMQIGSGGLWTAEDTSDFKATGKKLCEEIIREFPQTKIGILTGTQYDLSSLEGLPIDFLIRKPILPEKFEELVKNVLE